MRITIQRLGDTIACYKDYKDIHGHGEIAQLLMEIEMIRDDLVGMYRNYEEKPKNSM